MSNPICINCQKVQLDKNFCYYCFRDYAYLSGCSYEMMKGYPGLDHYDGECTYKTMGHNFYNQPYYRCRNCFPNYKNEGVCWSCADDCREKEHDLTLIYGPFFCDKGYELAKELERQKKIGSGETKKNHKCVIL